MGDPQDIKMTEDGTEPDIVSGRDWLRRALKGAGVAVLALAAMVLTAIFLLDTSPGRRFVADRLAGLEFENGMQIEVGRIEGSLYSKMVLHDLTVKDPKGEFLYSPEVRIDWRPFAFLSNHVDIRSATAERMMLRRLPEFRELPPSDRPLLPDLDIDIGNLKIERFILETPATGKRSVATIFGQAHIESGRARVKLDGRTLAIKDSAGGDRLSIDLDAVPEQDKLTLSVDLSAPTDGVIAGLVGLSKSLDLKIGGSGDWEAWNGELKAEYGSRELARLKLLGRNGTFAIKGPARLESLIDGSTANLFGPIAKFDIAVALKKRTAELSGNVSSDAFTFKPDGKVDLSDNSFEDLKLDFVLLKPSVLTGDLRASGLRAMFLLDGKFAKSAIGYSIQADRFVMDDVGLHNFIASGSAKIDAGQVFIPVNAKAQRFTGLDSAAGGALANVRLSGDLTIKDARVLSDNLHIRSNRIDAKAVLLANLETGLYLGAIDGTVDNFRLESVGIFNVDADADLKFVSPRGFGLQGRILARSSRLLDDSLRDYLGGNFVVASDVNYGTDGTIRLSNLRFESPDLHVAAGSGSYSPNGRIALNANATSDRYGKIGIRATGTMRDPQARITADRPGLGIGLARLDAEITGVREGYRFKLTGKTDYGPLRADVTLATGRATSLAINIAALSGITFSGSLVQTRDGPFKGKLAANGNGLGGIVRLDQEGRYQEVVFKLRANDTEFGGAANVVIGSAIIDGRAILYDQLYLVSEMQFSDLRYASFDLNAGRVRVDIRDGRGHAKALLEGSRAAPFRVAANVQLKPDLWRVMLDGKMRGIAFKTARPARIVPKDDTYELLSTQIDFGQGNIRLAGHLGDGMNIQSRLEKIDLAMLNTMVPGLGLGGKVTGSLDLAQSSPTAFPRADARLKLDNFTRTTASTVSQPVDINFVGKLLADGGEARAVFRRRGSVIGRMNASLRPLPLGAGPWMKRMIEAPLGGGLRYNGPAATLFSLTGQPRHALSGSLGVAADFSCQLKSPCLSGIVRGKHLTYESEKYGTRLTNMELSGRFDGDKLQLEKLEANAGKGTIKGSGYVSLSSISGYPMDISLSLDKAQLARSDAISTSATGNLQLIKVPGQTALLSGQLRLPETHYKIIREGPAQVPQLIGVRFTPRYRKRITGDEPADPIPSIFTFVQLDIYMRAPEKLFVAGMGLESEWRADIKVTGTSAEPRMGGSVKLVRGTLGFAGRSFKLTQGAFDFTGGQVVDPRIKIVATEEIEDVAVNVNVNGRASNPQITFTSTPSLPGDEILSRILFGNSIANLSALQAVQLATSLNSLRGSGGGLNPLGKLRSATGVDRLRILGEDEESGRGTAFAAGKYLTNDIYVELITDTGGFTATQLEVSITPWLSVLSQAGGSGNTRVDVRVKKNY